MPLAVASIGTPHSLEVAARNGLRVISAAISPRNDADALAKQWRFIERIARDAGRSVTRDDWSIQAVVYVADTVRQAQEDIRDGAEHQLRDYWYHVGVRAGFEDYRAQPGEAIDVDRVARTRGWIIGDPDHCVAEIMALVQASGGFGGLILTVLDWTSREKWQHSQDLFARYVVPEIQGTTAGLVRSWEKLKDDSAAGKLPSPFGPPQKPIED
jgi:limonene 1,2-monooxygenase